MRFGLGMFGLAGWPAAVLTVLGVALGVRIDKRWPGRASGTLTLLFLGVLLGCMNAWNWIEREGPRNDGDACVAASMVEFTGAALAGMLLGSLYNGGRWFTVRHAAQRRHPGLWVAASVLGDHPAASPFSTCDRAGRATGFCNRISLRVNVQSIGCCRSIWVSAARRATAVSKSRSPRRGMSPSR